jgi:hypothetical protein
VVVDAKAAVAVTIVDAAVKAASSLRT